MVKIELKTINMMNAIKANSITKKDIEGDFVKKEYFYIYFNIIVKLININLRFALITIFMNLLKINFLK